MVLSSLSVTIVVPVISIIVYVLVVGYRRRSRINALRKLGVAMPAGWSWWFGHLRVLDEKLKKLPPDANVYMAMHDIVPDHADSEVFLMDYWPVAEPMLMIFGIELSHQTSTKYDLPKPSNQEHSFSPIIGGSSLITMNGEQWKFWRSLLNPGFSASHMLSLIPNIVDAVDVFCELLEQNANKGLFSLDDMTTRLAMDVITRTTLDTDLDNQRNEHKFAHALNTILNWHSFWDPRILLNPLRVPVQWYYGRIMSSFIRGELSKRFVEMKRSKATINDSAASTKKAKSVIALALEEYITRKQEHDKTPLENIHLDENFARIAANQIRLFIFAGNDTTATAIGYTYHMLSQHPTVLAKVRSEHDTIFGSDTDPGALLRQQPALINQCRYTLAVIKETLRLYPPASSIRDGLPGVSFVDRKGTSIPTEHLSATIMHNYVHVNPRLWHRPLEFLPDRWLVNADHKLYPPPGAFRPFEHGPRNCIGQTLVLNEIRVALIMTARRFYLQPAYEEFDALERAKEGVWMELMRKVGIKGKECKVVLGERAYQTSRSGAHPADGYPCRVSLVGK
ncbi:cytochrome P450 [Ophiobolus disseminans]|uniref:Cytochrome P450 n=1 Tax=Ophiobolus disseminans TaxID=1469910 RepID=A0A6A6ZEU4_9PLEO|nr:cytochrome P450 [Ophiobolus disseminans]